MSTFKGLSVMIGAVSETDSLRQTVKEIVDICDHKDITEIIVCYPERITPACYAVVKELSETDLGVPFVAFQQNRPFMAAIKDMIDIAKGSHCILFDSDMALDINTLPKLIELTKNDPDTIHSLSRWKKGCKFYGYGKFRKLVNFCAQKFLSVLYMKNLTDFTIPVQIAPVELYKSIKLEEEGFPILLELVLKPLRLGCNFTETPTNCYSRKQGKSSNSIKQTISYLPVALRVRFMKKEDILLDKKD